jgi:hypothetical protein
MEIEERIYDKLSIYEDDYDDIIVENEHDFENDTKKSTKRKRNLISALPTRKEKNITKEEAKFSNFLVQPTLLQNIPLDFYDNWACIVAPNGVRCSVMTKTGETISRKANGSFIESFHSRLPNGGSTRHHTVKDKCILDCILYDEKYYILDIFEWCGTEFEECEFDCRMYCLTSKFEEEVSSKNDNTISLDDNKEKKSTIKTRECILLNKFTRDEIFTLSSSPDSSCTEKFPWDFQIEKSVVYMYSKEGHYYDTEKSNSILCCRLEDLLRKLGQNSF